MLLVAVPAVLSTRHRTLTNPSVEEDVRTGIANNKFMNLPALATLAKGSTSWNLQVSFLRV